MKIRILVAVTCAFVAAPAMAGWLGTATVHEAGVSPGLIMDVRSSGYSGGAWVGVYNLHVAGATYAPEYLNKDGLASFCIDIHDFSVATPTPYGIETLDKTPDSAAGPMGTIRAGYLATLLNKYWTPGLTDIQAAALQAAVWEIVDEGNIGDGKPNDLPDYWGNVLNDDLATRGNFYVGRDDVATLANSWLSVVKGLGQTLDFTNYVGLTSPVPGTGQYQDYVVRVPLPASVLLVVFAVGVAGRKLRKFV